MTREAEETAAGVSPSGGRPTAGSAPNKETNEQTKGISSRSEIEAMSPAKKQECQPLPPNGGRPSKGTVANSFCTSGAEIEFTQKILLRR